MSLMSSVGLCKVETVWLSGGVFGTHCSKLEYMEASSGLSYIKSKRILVGKLD